QPLDEREAEPGALMPLRGTAVELVEFDKQLAEIVGGDADAGVLDVDAEHLRSLGPDLDAHPAAVRRELDGVPQEAVENLLQAPRVEGAAGDLGVDRRVDAQTLAVRKKAQRVALLVNEGGKVNRLGAEIHLPRLDLREIEHVVDELEQVLRA